MAVLLQMKNVDMTLHKGEILGLLGANGAGKTTFIKMLLGLYPIDGGELTLLGNADSNPRRPSSAQSEYRVCESALLHFIMI